MGGKSLFQVGVAVEFWRVLIHLSTLAFCLVLFESLLHHVEHKLARYDKYQHMLRKAYRELMILGLISLGIKLLKEIKGLNSESKTVLAFQVADLTIFILALALILQAVVVFLQLRKFNKLDDRTELITAKDLVKTTSPPAGTPPTAHPAVHASKWTWCKAKKLSGGFDKEVVQRRLLRHLFLKRFGLPQLFPYSKYLRRAQANQISHMVEVEPSMWVLLLAVAWAIYGVLELLHRLEVDLPEDQELVQVFVVFAWALIIAHVAVLLYLHSCLQRLLRTAGYSDDEQILMENLQVIAEEEAAAWQNETADNALDTMNRVHEELEEMEDERNARVHSLLQKDEGLQLVATCWRKINHVNHAKGQSHRALSGAIRSPPALNLRFFSRKAWHLVVMFLFILNGFYIALLVQCAVFELDDIYEKFGLAPAVMVPLPLFLNTFVLQRRIFRIFVTVCSLLRVEATTLGEVVAHFSEIVDLRSEFASSLLACLKAQAFTLIDVRREVRAFDPRQSGFIELDKLRAVLCAFGFRLTRFRFNSLMKMLFQINGTKVEYGQVLRLLTLAQQDTSDTFQGSRIRQHPLLQRSRTSLNDGDNAASHFMASRTMEPGAEPRPNDSGIGTSGIGLRHVTRGSEVVPALRNSESRGRAFSLERSYVRQFSSSRALHDVYNINTDASAQMDNVPSDTVYTVL